MSILLTGGTGNTGGHLARLLHDASKPFFVASRDPLKVAQPYPGIKFDWFDEETWHGLPFDHVEHPIRSVYLILPPGPDDKVVSITKKFINLAIEKGVNRFALISSSSLEKGQPEMAMGLVHGYLDEKGVEYCALRPSWFMENFTGYNQARRSPDNFAIYSATEDGRTPFVATQDIAQAAFNVLTSSAPMPTDLIIVGPELLSHDDVAKTLATVTGNPWHHIRLTADELTERFVKIGIPLTFARPLAYLDLAIAKGHAEAAFHVDNKFVGRIHFKDLAMSLLTEH